MTTLALKGLIVVSAAGALLCALPTTAAAASGPSDKDLAYIASLAYSPDLKKASSSSCKGDSDICMPSKYRKLVRSVQRPDHEKFQAVAIMNSATGDLVIAYRGTSYSKRGSGGIHADVGLFKAAVTSTGASCLRSAIEKAMGQSCTDNSATCWAAWSANKRCGVIGGDWDWTLTKLAGTVAQADKFYSKALKAAGNIRKVRKVHVTGHSLGGYLAVYIGAKYRKHTVTFNAPSGARYALVNSKSKMSSYDRDALKNIKNYRRENDLVSSFSGFKDGQPKGHTGKICLLKAASNPLSAHFMAGVIPLIKSGISCADPPRTTWFW